MCVCVEEEDKMKEHAEDGSYTCCFAASNVVHQHYFWELLHYIIKGKISLIRLFNINYF